ncbi:MAG: ATP-binding cassette domain-containing protein, partial [Pseudomonadota bacterium]
MTEPTHIQIKDVTLAYRTASGPLPVLDRLRIDLAEGSFTAVVGPSGCGKSTLTLSDPTQTSPESGLSSPAISLVKVDFPHPEGPTT